MVHRTKQSRHSTGKRPKQAPFSDTDRHAFFQNYLYFLEGLADYSNANHAYGNNPKDHRTLGWAIGRQIVSLYLLEMLLRIDYERQGITGGTNHHHLAKLFRGLPQYHKTSVENTYKRILNNRVEWTWDVFRTVESFLDFLGNNPIVKTRYPWQQREDTLYSPKNLSHLVYAFYIALHGYPVAEGSLDKRFDTEFRSLEESRKDRYDSKRSRHTQLPEL